MKLQKTTDGSEVVSVRIGREMLESLDEVAEREHRTRSGQIVYMLEIGLESEQNRTRAGRIPVPISVDTVEEAAGVPRALRPSAPPAIERPARKLKTKVQDESFVEGDWEA
jgi:hypothetical protein